MGNYIGIGSDGVTTILNETYGIATLEANTSIGDGTTGGRNIIHGGISITVGPATIQGNYIGLDVSGNIIDVDELNGVSISGSAVTVGGASVGSGNVIAGFQNNINITGI